MTDYLDIRRALSAHRLRKYGPPDDNYEQWLKQMDECAQDLGLPNVYRTHPFKMPARASNLPVQRDRGDV